MSGTLLSTLSKTAQEKAQHAAYEREREAVAGKMAAKEAKAGEQVGEFLRYIVEGEQDKAEERLKEVPALALKKGTVTDLSQREFKHITGFQYAVWALDWHMWKMLLKYMPKEAAALQFVELEEKGTVHGKHFSLSPLIKALNTYVKSYGTWYKASAWDKIKQHWCQEVGGCQLLLPAHVIHEYCHPSRSFVPCPVFNEESLPRRMQLSGGGNWFTMEYRGGKLGVTFGILRHNWSAAAVEEGGFRWWVVCLTDIEALQRLSKMRLQQREKLKADLHQYWVEVRELVNVHFPWVLTDTIMNYLK